MIMQDTLTVIGSLAVWYGIYLLITGKYGDIEQDGKSTGRFIGLFMILTMFLGMSTFANVVRILFFLGVLVTNIMSRPKSSQSGHAEEV